MKAFFPEDLSMYLYGCRGKSVIRAVEGERQVDN